MTKEQNRTICDAMMLLFNVEDTIGYNDDLNDAINILKNINNSDNDKMSINLDTKAEDVFKILISKLSATQFLKLYAMITNYAKSDKRIGG